MPCGVEEMRIATWDRAPRKIVMCPPAGAIYTTPGSTESLSAVANRYLAQIVQALRKWSSESRGHVLHNQNANRQVSRQQRQDFLKSLGTTRRCANCNNVGGSTNGRRRDTPRSCNSRVRGDFHHYMGFALCSRFDFRY